MLPQFVPGGELNRALYQEVIAPILVDLNIKKYSACLLGTGSDVLGYDTAMSMDHDWGPRLQIFLEYDNDIQFIKSELSKHLPLKFHGFPVFVSRNDDNTTRLDADHGTEHRIEVTNIDEFFSAQLGIDVAHEWTMGDWLLTSQQNLLQVTKGFLYRDDLGVEQLRNRFRFFPKEITIYILASLWQRIGQEEHLVGRAGYEGDELGAKIIAARLVRDLMRICFLLEGKYFPYPKWLGKAFSELACASAIAPICELTLNSCDWQSRDKHLARLFEAVAELQNNAQMCIVLPGKVQPFFGRPFSAIHLHSPFADALRDEIKNPDLSKIANDNLIGSIDIWSDNTDLLCSSGKPRLIMDSSPSHELS